MVRSLTSQVFCLVGFVGVLMTASNAPAGSKVIRQLTLDDKALVVDLFDGMESGQLQVRLVAKSANDATVFIKNTTDAPLTVSVPKAAVGVPILPQIFGQNPFGGNQAGNPFGQGPGNNQQGGAGASQSIGGQLQPFVNQQQGNQQQGFPNQGANNNQGFFGNGQFSIPPEKTAQLKMRTVCLDYGLPEPHVGLKYELRSLETAISNPALRQLLEDYSPRVNQDAMQAAAWHLSNGLNWKQVSNLPDPGVPFGIATMFTANTANTVKAAQELVQQAETAAEKRAKEPAKRPAAPPAKLVTTSVLAK